MWSDIFRRKKYEVPCVCYDAIEQGVPTELAPSECLAHTLNHLAGGYKEKHCKYCNYDDVKYQYQVKVSNLS